MLKKVATYISAHVAQLVGVVAGATLVITVGYAAVTGVGDTDAFGEMAWEKNAYSNDKMYGSASYQVGEVDESDNRLHEDEGHDEGLNDAQSQSPDSQADQDQGAALAGATVQSDDSTVVTDETNVTNDPNDPGSATGPGGAGNEDPSGNGPGGSGGNTPGGAGGSGSGAPAITDEQKGQLSAKDDYVDESGNRLVSLRVDVPANWSFAIGESYRPDGVTVTATFKKPDGSTVESVIPYGGKNGYSAYVSKAWSSGTHDAIFNYGGLTAHAMYTVFNKRYDVSYGSFPGNGTWYVVKFPGDHLGDQLMEDAAEKIQEEAIPRNVVGGFFTDLTDAHRFMITVLGDGDIYTNFKDSNDTGYSNVRFLTPQDAGEGVDLTMMAVGFVSSEEKDDEDALRRVYLPSEEDGTVASMGALMKVEDVPDGFHVQRVAGTSDNGFLGDQVLVGYSGSETSIKVPMGVTKIALTKRNDGVTDLTLPESVLDIDYASLTECFPNLERIQVGDNNSQSYSSYQDVLYSANGLQVVYVPPKHASMNGDTGSWSPYAETIAEGAFANCDIDEVVVPSWVKTIQKDAFAGSTIDELVFQSEAPVSGMADSGYEGSFFVPDSAYDSVCKQWAISLGPSAESTAGAMCVGTQGGASGDPSGGSSGGASGGTSGVAPGTYAYSSQFDAVVLSAEPTVLVGLRADAPKAYTVAQGVTALGEGAFAASTELRDIVLPDSVQEFRENSLAGLSDGTIITLLGPDGSDGSGSGDQSGPGSGGSGGAHVAAIDKNAFGGTVPDVTVSVPSALYGDYLKAWSATLGADTAQRILKAADTTYRYSNGAKYLVLDPDASSPRLRLLEVYDEGQTFFEPEPGTVEIADGAFSGCASLEIVHIPDQVTSLGEGLFEGCTNLESVLVSNANLPAPDTHAATLYRPGMQPVAPGEGSGAQPDSPGASSIPSIPSVGTDYEYDSATGVLYGTDAAGSLTLINVPTDTATISVRAGTAQLGDEAFEGCAHLSDAQDSVVFETPETLKSIGAHCFDGCTSMEAVDLSGFSSLATVGDSAFTGCTALKTVALPDSATSVGAGAFKDCTALTHFVACGITELKAQTLSGCSSLRLVKAPKVTVIGDECFYGCERLELLEDSIVVDAGAGDAGAAGDAATGATGETEGVAYEDSLNIDNITWIGDRAFAYCVSFANDRETTLDMKSLQHLGTQAFMGCHTLRTVVLPSTLTEMGEEAFRDCAALSDLEIDSSLSTIGRYSFYGCVNLTTVDISEHQQGLLEVVGACAFANCDLLERLDLSGCAKLVYVGDRAFEDCDELLRITLPSALTKVSDRCFEGCPNLSIVELASETPTALGASVFGESAPEYVRIWVRDQQAYDKYLDAYQQTLDPEYGEGYAQFVLEVRSDTSETLRGITYTATGDGHWVITDALENLSGDVTLTNDVVAIGPEAFKGCTKLTGIEYDYGASISLGDRAFEGCENLRTALLYGSIPEWGDSVFAGCTNLDSLVIGGSAANDHVSCVGPRAFAGCTSLPMVTFRAPVDAIAEEAFADCTGLTAIASTAEFRKNVVSYGDRAFIRCTNLKTAPLSSTYKKLEYIGSQAFYDCDTLNGVSIPVNTKTVGEACFAECGKLKTASFYGALEEIPKDCFKNCPSLLKTGGTPAAFSGLKVIGEGAFEGCISLEITTTDAAHASGAWSLEKYTSLTTIGDRAFSGAFTHQQAGYGNPRLDEVTLAATLQHVGAGAFDGCVGLKRITLQSTPTLGANAFVNMADGFVLEVPAGTYDAYLPVLSASVGEDAAVRMLYDASRSAAAAAASEAVSETADEATNEPAGEAANEVANDASGADDASEAANDASRGSADETSSKPTNGVSGEAADVVGKEDDGADRCR